MTLAAGTRLGPYEILSKVGEGGMGEVYKARDTRLDRIVAIKVLPPQLALNAEMRERFEREAHAIASLQHPNICVLHDIGEQDGLHYLVMEYLEGETLAVRLLKGPLPLDQVLRYAIEISDALDKAHRQGYTHRDIKPANIMLTKSGSKILDFGLAKLKPPIVRTDIPFSEMPTPPPGSPLPPGWGPDALTADGTMLGTIFYMAPEQLEGRADDVDGRADIFSFGAMVYEMLTGQRAFAGKSQASVIASILKDEPPPMSTLQPPDKLTPPALDRLVKKCLSKDRDRRWQAASDVCDELKWIAEGGSQAGMRAPVTVRRVSRYPLAWAVAAVAIVIAGALGVVNLRRGPEVESDRVVFSITTPGMPTTLGSFSLSPDGRSLAYTAPDSSGTEIIWVRRLNSLGARPLPGTEGVEYQPFWSPDNRSLGFFAEGKLKKVELSGGSVQSLTDGVGNAGGSWNRDGVIIFSRQVTGGLARISEAGGPVLPLTSLDLAKGEIFHRFPQFLPDDRHFLYFIRAATEESSGIFVGSLDSKDVRQLLKTDIRGAYAAPALGPNGRLGPGHLLFVRDQSLMAQPFDVARLELSGEPFVIAEDVTVARGVGSASFSLSETGLLAYENSGVSTQLMWVDRSGRRLGPLGAPAEYAGPLSPELSPDGKRLAVVRSTSGAAEDIWVMDAADGTASRFTFDPSRELSPLWSPDGSRLLFRSNRDGGVFNFYEKSSSGAGNEEQVYQSAEQKYPGDWSSDGRYLLYTIAPENTGVDLWVLPLTGDRKPFPYLQTEANETSGQFSPDEKWVAYVSNESGRNEVYIQSFPTPGGKRQVSTNGGVAPRWRRDGKEVFYVSADRKMMAASVRGQNPLEVGVPAPLFLVQIMDANTTPSSRATYAVSSDGRRFLIALPVEMGRYYTVMMNWASGVRRR